jgi:NADPH-dependent curcumin reductase
VVKKRQRRRPPTDGTFSHEEHTVPVGRTGQLLMRNLYLSLDPYLRGRISDAPSYAAPVVIGDVMVAATVFARGSFAPSRFPTRRHNAGLFGGWQTYALSDGKGLTKLDLRTTH